MYVLIMYILSIVTIVVEIWSFYLFLFIYRYGKIISTKAIIDQQTNKCKGESAYDKHSLIFLLKGHTHYFDLIFLLSKYILAEDYTNVTIHFIRFL